MSDITDREVIDLVLIEDGKQILVISDHLEWKYSTRREHAGMLQNKINDYLTYIAGGQAEEAHPGCRCVIRLVGKYPFSRYCLDYLERVRNFIRNKDDICDIEWQHLSQEVMPEDGFSDDFQLDLKRVYPRLKKNWSKKPLEEVSLMAVYQDSPAYGDMPMYRYLDSFVYMFVQDMGDTFLYLTYDMLPEDITPEILQENAFRNLDENITYRACDSKEKGIYGIAAGGDFEAEALLFPSIWQQLSEQLNDDVVISVPTKDVVFYTSAGNGKYRRKMKRMAADLFEQNRKESPALLFCRDIFIYSRKEGKLYLSRNDSL